MERYIFFDGVYGAEIFFPCDWREKENITCVCGKEDKITYVKEFEIETNIFEIQKWALNKMNYNENNKN